jgi:hypothetical protein
MGKIADILQARDDLDEALRIRREEELPVYERLKDIRSRAVTMGKIADILQARGDLDEALRIRRTEQLPTFRLLDDARGCSITLQKIASTLIAAGGVKKGKVEEIHSALAESFDIALRLGLLDGIASTGILLAPFILVRGGPLDEALAVVDKAETAHQKLAKAGKAINWGRLREELRISHPLIDGKRRRKP